MRRSTVGWLGFALPLFLLAIDAACAAPPVMGTEGCAGLRRNVAAAALPLQPTPLAIEALDPATDCRVSINGARPMPMMSVYKIPIAVAVYDAADRGFDLQALRTVQVGEAAGGHSPLGERLLSEGPVQMSYADLLESMVISSDNTASDVLLETVGGPQAVTALLRRHGLEGIRIDRYERQINADHAKRPALEAIGDPRDTATARSLVDLLQKLHEGKLLSPASTKALLDGLGRVRTGARRLKAGMPPDWGFAHKTGTGELAGGLPAATNDVGIMLSPGGCRLYLAVLVGAGATSYARRDAVMAEIGHSFARWMSTCPRAAPAR